MSASAADVPRLLRESRLGAGLTQAELARRLGVSQAAVAKLERAGANPTIDTLDRVLWATGRSLQLDARPRPRAGVDESLIRRQLELTPAQRIEGIEEMNREVRELKTAGAAVGARRR